MLAISLQIQANLLGPSENVKVKLKHFISSEWEGEYIRTFSTEVNFGIIKKSS